MTEPHIIICIKSCKRDQYNGYNDNCRTTWLQDLRGANYCFVLGNGATRLHPDELILNCGDDYNSLPHKTQELCKWVVTQDYDFMAAVDTDTFVIPDRFLSSGFDKYDYYGYFNGEIGKPKEVYWCLYAWASGGSGYFLSKRAAQIIAEVNIDSYSMCPELKIPCEDLAAGQVLGPYIERGELTAAHDSRFGRSWRGDYKVDVTAHAQTFSAGRPLPSDWMMNHYLANK